MEDMDEVRRQLSKLTTGSSDLFRDVRLFHEHFKLTYDGPPRELPPELKDFREKFIREEHDEFWDAETDSERLDAICDLIYVLLGYAYLRGWNFPEAWRRVQRANMGKVRAKRPGDSKRGTTHDVVKPVGWVAPNHEDLV